jgi:hypothetical protein
MGKIGTRDGWRRMVKGLGGAHPLFHPLSTFHPSNQTENWITTTTFYSSNQIEKSVIPNQLVGDILIP